MWEETLSSIRRQLRKKSGVLLPPEDIVSGIRGLLNESAAAELEDIKISLPKKRSRRGSADSTASDSTPGEPAPSGVDSRDESPE